MPGFARRTPARRQGKHSKHTNSAVQRKCNLASDIDVIARLFDAPPVDSDIAFLDHALRERTALHQPDEEEEAIDPQRPTA